MKRKNVNPGAVRIYTGTQSGNLEVGEVLAMKITIEELEAYLYERYGERGQETDLFMKLVEEIGEVAEILNKRAGRKAEHGENLKTELANELADVIHYVVSIAAINDIDLNDVILEKDKRASVKYHHERNLEQFVLNRNQ